MSTETTNKKIKIDNGTTFGRTYTDKAIDAKLPTDLIASANKLSLGAGNTALGNGVNLDGFTYDESTKTLKASGGAANKLYKHTINCWSSSYGSIYLTIYNISIEQINSEEKIKAAIKSIGEVIATGFFNNGFVFNVYYVRYFSNDDRVAAMGYRVDTTSGSTKISTSSITIDYHFSSIEDNVNEVM